MVRIIGMLTVEIATVTRINAAGKKSTIRIDPDKKD
jgi:hypothetical protein